jgi:hypothetical protein
MAGQPEGRDPATQVLSLEMGGPHALTLAGHDKV